MGLQWQNSKNRLSYCNYLVIDREVIEKLQSKLKKSISRKLAKQGNAGVSLLHKGLPTSIQSHMWLVMTNWYRYFIFLLIIG